MSDTARLLTQGGFKVDSHRLLGDDIVRCLAEDPQSWPDMTDVVARIHAGQSRPRDWDSPLYRRRGSDIGEIRMSIGPKHYRLYVHAPRRRQDFLVLLHFDWKPGGDRGLQIQDCQIDEAFRRLNEWYAVNP